MLTFLFKKDPIREFWREFCRLAPALGPALRRGDNDAVSAACRKLMVKLARVEPNLRFEIIPAADGALEFCISAARRRERFALARRVAAQAPMVVGWRARAFTPRRAADDVSRRIGGFKIPASRTRFVAAPGAETISVEVWIDAQSSKFHPKDLTDAAHFFLECAIGEFDAAACVRAVTARIGVPEEGVAFEAFPAVVDDWRARRAKLRAEQAVVDGPARPFQIARAQNRAEGGGRPLALGPVTP